MQQNNRDLFTTLASYDCYKAMEVTQCFLVDSMLRKQLKLFYSMYFTFNEQNCITHFLIM